MLLRTLPLVFLAPTFLAQDVGVGLERAFPRLRFERPIFLTGAGDGSGRLFVAEQDGVIRVFANDEEVGASEVFLDIRERISRRGNEEGLLGLAFAPDHATSGAFYVHYSSSVKNKVGVVSRFHVHADDPGRADPDSEEVVLEQPQPYRNHNGGSIAFGPDGMLYVSFGDGGAGDDPHAHGQNLATWLGAILRVDVSAGGPGYTLPPDNPFVGRDDARPELWAIGLRNVWRFSFDRESGALWAADIGQDLWEEVDVIERGGNYGWNTHEATHAFEGGVELASGTQHSPPVAEYGRQEGISITGGAVYRGARFPELAGRYYYGDYVSGNLWSCTLDGDVRLERRTGRSIASFGEDDAGELFLLSFDGGLWRLVPSDEPSDVYASWPQRLSESGLFASMEDRTPAPHLVPYEVNVPFWSDGAEKQRFFALPEGEAFGYRAGGSWEIPVGTTLVKTFRAQTGRRLTYLETRVIERKQEGWEAATYVWNEDQTEAELAPEGRQFELWTRDSVKSWHAPSASECASCHIEANGFALGITTAQLHHASQLSDWVERGLLELAADASLDEAHALAASDDAEAALGQRARAWLDVNCAMCHLPDGPGNAAIDLRFGTPLARTGLVDGEAAQGDFGLPGARLLSPGEPASSVLLHRVRTRGDGRMPNVASNEVDEQGAALIEQWIASMESEWVSLFDGESLAGWTQRNGTASYRVEDGAIVGRTTDGSPNSFLCSDRGYSDFELEFEVRVHDRLNSGVQIRSSTRGGFTGRVNGPQVEIEASGGRGAEAGYLYAEAAGGWMTPGDVRTPHKHFVDGEWNAYRVVASGARIQTWINGAQVSDLVHEGMYASHPRGFIGLQVHGIGRGQGPFEVSWRNIRLRELRGEEHGWTPLYNGRDLDGWETSGNWLIEDEGVLAIRPREGEQGWQRYGDYLWSEREYADFVLDLEYSYPPGGNSGVYFRVADREQPVTRGIEAQILDSSGKTGEMTHHDHGGIISTIGASRNMSAAPGEWNRMIVTAIGSQLVVELNGATIVDIDLEGSAVGDRPLSGYIGLQDHGVPHELRFRNIWLKEL